MIATAAERGALVRSLQDAHASIAPKYFYDALGCALYAAICELPEYYPTRTERAIFGEYRDAIALAVGRGRQLVDLGAGDCAKALAWLPLLAPSRYIAVDIAGVAIARSLARMAPDFRDRHAGNRRRLLRRPRSAERSDRRPVNVLLSRIVDRQFRPDEAAAFLATFICHSPAPTTAGLLIGVDTRRTRRPQRGLRRCARRHRGVQPQRPASREPGSLAPTSCRGHSMHRGFYDPRARAASRCTWRRPRRRPSGCPERSARSRPASASTRRIRTSTPLRNSSRCSGGWIRARPLLAGRARRFRGVLRRESGSSARARRTPENCQRASGGKKLR